MVRRCAAKRWINMTQNLTPTVSRISIIELCGFSQARNRIIPDFSGCARKKEVTRQPSECVTVAPHGVKMGIFARSLLRWYVNGHAAGEGEVGRCLDRRSGAGRIGPRGGPVDLQGLPRACYVPSFGGGVAHRGAHGLSNRR